MAAKPPAAGAGEPGPLKESAAGADSKNMNEIAKTKWRATRDGYTVTHRAEYRGFLVEVESYGKAYGPHWELTMAGRPDWIISRTECRYEANIGIAKANALAKADELLASWEADRLSDAAAKEAR